MGAFSEAARASMIQGEGLLGTRRPKPHKIWCVAPGQALAVAVCLASIRYRLHAVSMRLGRLSRA